MKKLTYTLVASALLNINYVSAETTAIINVKFILQLNKALLQMVQCLLKMAKSNK